jgi:FkbM family methyltransferase
MSLKKTFKGIAISCGFYRPLKLIHRRLFEHEALRRLKNNIEFYAPFLAPGDLCFDIGSNVGEKAEAFLALGAKVVAFEPQPFVFREMKARCGPSRRLIAVNAAVGAAPGKLPMYVCKQSQSSSLVSDWTQNIQEVIQVPVTTLDHAIERYGLPRFCKIDVEGFELEVLKGLNRALPCITLEYHLSDDDIMKVIGCVDYLSRFGDLSMNVTLGEELKFAWPNWVTYESFRAYFPSRAPRTPICAYGDLFIRIQSGDAFV